MEIISSLISKIPIIIFKYDSSIWWSVPKHLVSLVREMLMDVKNEGHIPSLSFLICSSHTLHHSNPSRSNDINKARHSLL